MGLSFVPRFGGLERFNAPLEGDEFGTGRQIGAPHGRESVSEPVPRDDLGTAEDRRPEEWQPLGEVLKRVVARLPDPRR